MNRELMIRFFLVISNFKKIDEISLKISGSIASRFARGISFFKQIIIILKNL